MTSILNTLLKTSAVAIILSTTAATVTFMSTTEAYAERGKGNGNGNGRGNGGRDRAESRGNQHASANGNGRGNGNGNSDGRGALARELGSLNAAHANPNALRNASPNSMPGKLYAYQQARGDFADVVAVQDEAYAEYQRLIGLSEEEITAEFPEGGYEDAVTTAANDYQAARDDALDAQAETQEVLAALTGGSELSPAALAELNRLLGL